MNGYTLTLSGGADLYVEKVLALTDKDAIQLAEDSADGALRDGDWEWAALTNDEGAEIWRRHRLNGQK
jgi:hypothetical protein